jgi:cysteine synthase A
VFAAYHASGDHTLTSPRGSRIEGIGRPRVEPSFIREVIDRMFEVADLDSIAAMRVLSDLLNRRVGPSTGTSFIAVLKLRQEMIAAGEKGSVVSLICDSGERYRHLFDDAMVEQQFGKGLRKRVQAVQAQLEPLASR